MTHYCSTCEVFWPQFMTRKRGGSCPECGTGVTRSQEPMSRNAPELYAACCARAVVQHAQETARADSAARRESFEDFYTRRERERDAAQPTDEIDSELIRLELLGQTEFHWDGAEGAKLAAIDPEARAA